MRFLGPAIFGLALLGVAAPPAALAAPSTTRPNIVVFYLDDVAPHDGRLWSNPSITPALYHAFVEQGIRFSRAIGEDPWCCPGRGNFLTGLHTHNNGVNSNDIRQFNPQESIAVALRRAGYATLWAGKYLNRPDALPETEWPRHFSAWTNLDVTFGYNRRVRTSSGYLQFPDRHTTQIVGDRTVLHLRQTAPDKPVFAVLSIPDMHAPNIPVPQTEARFAKCDAMRPWKPPNYDEAGVNDKPAYVRALNRLPYSNGWPMTTYCREMLGVDDVVRQVIAELAAEGRLDNTLLVLTADNGMTWGAHRLGQVKQVPYATPVPLYMSWPAGWGTLPRTIPEPVSNIDLAPTFCALAGCALGPFPSGQSAPDGLSLVDLVEHGDSLGRAALLEVSVGPSPIAPAWRAVRTTPSSPLGEWHYIEYATGERELYDLVADPYELSNLAPQMQGNALIAQLHGRLYQLLNEGRVNRPDASVAGAPLGYYVGYNQFGDEPRASQTLVRRVAAGRCRFYVNVENNMTSGDHYVASANSTGSSAMQVRYFVGETDVTSGITGGGADLGSLAAEKTRQVLVRVTVGSSAPAGATLRFDLRVRSVGDAARSDVVSGVCLR